MNNENVTLETAIKRHEEKQRSAKEQQELEESRRSLRLMETYRANIIYLLGGIVYEAINPMAGIVYLLYKNERIALQFSDLDKTDLHKWVKVCRVKNCETCESSIRSKFSVPPTIEGYKLLAENPDYLDCPNCSAVKNE